MPDRKAKWRNVPREEHRSLASLVFLFSLVIMTTSVILLLSDFGERYFTARYWRQVAEKRAWAESYDWTEGGILPDFCSLYAENPDLVGWISMPDSMINYPVMQTPDDPEYYLFRNFERETVPAGAPFADYRCQVVPVQGFNTVLYAHDRLFLQLNQYGYMPEYFQTHQYLRFDTLTKTGLYRIAAVFYLDAGEARLLDTWNPDDPLAYECYNYLAVDSPEGFGKFANLLRERRMFETNVEISPRSRYLTLICCATALFSGIPNDAGRLIVVARCVGD